MSIEQLIQKSDTAPNLFIKVETAKLSEISMLSQEQKIDDIVKFISGEESEYIEDLSWKEFVEENDNIQKEYICEGLPYHIVLLIFLNMFVERKTIAPYFYKQWLHFDEFKYYLKDDILNPIIESICSQERKTDVTSRGLETLNILLSHVDEISNKLSSFSDETLLKQPNSDKEKRQKQLVKSEKKDIVVSDDNYRTIKYCGETIILTPRQAEVIKIFHAAFLGGFPEISKSFVFEELKYENDKGTIKNNFFKKHSDIYDKLIRKVPITKDIFRLNL